MHEHFVSQYSEALTGLLNRGRYWIAGKFGENEKNGYELILATFKFDDWAFAKVMMSSLLYYIMRGEI